MNSLIVDYGGSWTRVWALAPNGKKIRFLKNPSRPIQELHLYLNSLLNKWKVKNLESLIIGAKGVWKKKKREWLRSSLKGLAHNVTVLSDIELAYKLALRDGHGILVLAGTGSIAYGKDEKGHFARAGGLGPQRGDEGSGFWIGAQMKFAQRNRSLYSKLTPQKVREIASLAPAVIQKAKRKDPIAAKIIRSAQEHLARMAVRVSKQLDFKKSVPIALAGGLFKNAFFRRGFLQRLKLTIHYKVKIFPN